MSSVDAGVRLCNDDRPYEIRAMTMPIPKLDAKTKRALSDSIAHWGRLSTGQRKPREAPNAKDCALCQIYETPIHDEKDKCKGCPVERLTGDQYCVGTPYHSAALAHVNAGLNSDEFRNAALVQWNFLRAIAQSYGLKV